MKTILVVDDDPVDLKLISDTLEKFQYKIVTADNGLDSIAKARDIRPDLILMDILMPEMDGTEAYSLIKADPETEDIPVLFLTCALSKDEEHLGANIEESFFNVLAKPFKTSELVARIRDILGE
ncbi:MAG TPA: response regulator [Candidatus Omnitrophota bacterium]|jgi:two-component system cell cycle response regulator|nr:response regulator [Candidatus Omnitrophota bacterium]